MLYGSYYESPVHLVPKMLDETVEGELVAEFAGGVLVGKHALITQYVWSRRWMRDLSDLHPSIPK